MNNKQKISIFTGSRAEYGLLYWVIKELENRNEFDINVIATGTHLSKKMGYTVSIIREDFSDMIHEIDIDVAGTSPHEVSLMISKGIDSFSDYFLHNETDLIIILGDRFEILSVAIAALTHNIPVAHIGGGEVSEGAIDDSIRHCLTKLSHIHFPITERCANRIKSLGEDPSRIHVVGSTSLDILQNIVFYSKSELSKIMGFNEDKKLMLFVYHPETIDFENNNDKIDEVLRAIDEVDFEVIALYPNIDISSNQIIDKLKTFSSERGNVILIKNLERRLYLSLMKNADIMVGNSSSGIVESPSFCLPVINIGNRQNGRDKSENVIDCHNSYNSVLDAISEVTNNDILKSKIREMHNPNGDGFASFRIANILSEIDFKDFEIKKNSKYLNSQK
ncbi:UDP-N-acetylglucosamine 2-epimerase [Marine Group III euryarchaeote]|nr:UDP-N-acetylglucosamine 2-epimerase [Marine Group III euryarchaeote]